MLSFQGSIFKKSSTLNHCHFKEFLELESENVDLVSGEIHWLSKEKMQQQCQTQNSIQLLGNKR